MLCSGKHCQKKKQSLVRRLRGAATLVGIPTGTFKCIGTCDGPTVAVVINGKHRLFERLAKPKAQDEIILLAIGESSKPSSDLRRREVTGKKAKRATRKLQNA